MTDSGTVRPAVKHADEIVDEWWETLRGRPLLDRLFYTASEAADFSLLWHTAGVARAVRNNDPRSAVATSLALAIEAAIVNGAVKSLFGRRRPVQEEPRPHTLRQPLTSSFPSGHASAAMVAAAMLSRRGGSPIWYAAAAVVATSRVHVRIHHASDVVGGAVLGAVLGVAARRLADRYQA